ncbi:MAG TPA: hypothetical protein VK730_14425 [Solirubrobacteraceae bacterium]|nr:hypothetical protein [Solirubrobacteraceae bacterium]
MRARDSGRPTDGRGLLDDVAFVGASAIHVYVGGRPDEAPADG